MSTEYKFETMIEWTGNKGSGTFDHRSYERSHIISIPGKQNIEGSSDSTFYGDASKHNPEDLFISSLASCHMLWYLHLCARYGIIVMSYKDQAVGKMKMLADGSGSFEEITLNPVVFVTSPDMIQQATDLHDDASAMCFLSKSCNFSIVHQPRIELI